MNYLAGYEVNAGLTYLVSGTVKALIMLFVDKYVKKTYESLTLSGGQE